MYNNLPIRNLPQVTQDEARALALEMLAMFPVLRHIYDDIVIEDLTRRRTTKNLLLLRLIRHDPDSIAFWQSVIEDIDSLGAERVVATFAARMRRRELDAIESWRTELWLPAWLVRKGIAVVLEPHVGSNVPDFCAATDPLTWWEIKTPLDVPSVRADDALLRDLQDRLNRMQQPFDLSLKEYDLEPTDLPKVTAELKKQLVALAAEVDPVLPRSFTISGLVVEAISRSDDGRGEIVITTGKEFGFEGEHAALAARHIRDAARQLPADGAGVVVMDCSSASWLDEVDVQDACYGERRLCGTASGGHYRRFGGVFRPSSETRISAVVAYARNVVWTGKPYDIVVLHNPHARIPLGADVLRFPDVHHAGVDGTGRFYGLDR